MSLRSVRTQGSFLMQSACTSPLRITAAHAFSHGLWQSSLVSSGKGLHLRCNGWKSNSAHPRLAAVGRHRRLKGAVCGALSIGQDQFEEAVLKSDLPVLVDFWAEWCGPCKLVAPVVDWAAKNYDGQLKVYKVDTEANPDLVSKYKPYGLPTLVLFKDGEEVPGSRKEGAITKAKLQAHLDDLLPSLATK